MCLPSDPYSKWCKTTTHRLRLAYQGLIQTFWKDGREKGGGCVQSKIKCPLQSPGAGVLHQNVAKNRRSAPPPAPRPLNPCLHMYICICLIGPKPKKQNLQFKRDKESVMAVCHVCIIIILYLIVKTCFLALVLIIVMGFGDFNSGLNTFQPCLLFRQIDTEIDIFDSPRSYFLRRKLLGAMSSLRGIGYHRRLDITRDVRREVIVDAIPAAICFLRTSNLWYLVLEVFNFSIHVISDRFAM